MDTFYLSDVIKVLVDSLSSIDNVFRPNPNDDDLYEVFDYKLDKTIYIKVIVSTEKLSQQHDR